MKNFRPWLVYLTLFLIAVVSFINLWFTYHTLREDSNKNNEYFSILTGRAETNASKIKDSEYVLNEIADKVAEIGNSKTTAPVNGRDGKDGTGEKGEKGEKGDKGESVKGDPGVKGEQGDKGLTPIIRCNTEKNRWEIQYSPEFSWELINGEAIKCTVTKYDILKALTGF